MVDDLSRRGVKHWRRYFERHEDRVIEAANRVDVIGINRATLDLYRASDEAEVIATTSGDAMSAGELASFREQLIAFAEGETAIIHEAVETALDGGDVFTRIRAAIAQEHRETWARVYE